MPERLLCGTSLIDYRSEDRKKVGDFRGKIDAVGLTFKPSLRKPRSLSLKNEPFSQEMHLKVPLLSWILKLSNSDPGRSISALCFCVKKTPPLASVASG
jgi:hypothetical protein